MPTTPTTEQLQEMVSVICKVIGQIPCFHIYEDYVAERFGTTESEIALKAFTHNSALDSALISLRCFNEFFKPGARRDDVRAYHFHSLSMEPFLTSDDELAIHKYLAHITITRSDIVRKPWMLDEIVIRGLQRGVQFLSLIETAFPLNSEAVRAELRGVHTAANSLIPIIAKRHEPQVAPDEYA